MNINLTEIVFLLDRSGSMGGLESDTIGGFNAFVQKQCQLEGDTVVTAVLFDNKYEVLWDGIDANKANLTDKEYFARGRTALLDAVGKAILDVGHRLSKVNEDKLPSNVIFVITTDGLENASREFTYDKVKELIKHQQEKYGWEFIFLGANIDVAKEANSLGIRVKDAYTFEATETGMHALYRRVNEAVSDKRHSKKEKR